MKLVSSKIYIGAGMRKMAQSDWSRYSTIFAQIRLIGCQTFSVFMSRTFYS